MYNLERQRQILSILLQKKRCSVKKLSKELFASEATIRRDLNVLASEGKIEKVFGGAIICEHYAEEVPFSVRKDERVDVKQIICAKASRLIEEGMTVFLDSSSTTEQLVPYLKRFRNLQIVTNSPRVPLLLADSELQVYSTGGRISSSSQAYVGGIAEDVIEQINADIFFFSARGVSNTGIITDSAQNESRIKQKMIKNSKISCFLCDSKKVGLTYMSSIAKCNQIDYVFSDVELNEILRGKKQ
jgi:DeoR/GlpR family transcriptional regulator of sugar metabolism